jgi:hypothetical protein
MSSLLDFLLQENKREEKRRENIIGGLHFLRINKTITLVCELLSYMLVRIMQVIVLDIIKASCK